MGSKSSSTTQKTDVITTTNKNISDIDGVVANEGAVINQLDAGAVEESFNFGSDALDVTFASLDRIVDFADEVISDQSDQLSNTLSSINAANATEATITSGKRQDTIKQVVIVGALALMVFGSVWAFRRVKA